MVVRKFAKLQKPSTIAISREEIMAKIRHIAYRAVDVDAMAKFFVDAMGMKLIQKRKNDAIDLSDGSVNITVLPLRAGTPDGAPTKQPGIDHIGFTAENDQEQFRMLEAAGATKAGAVNLGTAYYEDKFRGPEDIIIDVGHWQGAAPIEK
jgi:catechol 2,3-dioxygenase-like lactoylglutathione lyase family enzyme